MGMYAGKYGEDLDPFEVRILSLYAQGLWRQEIAEQFHYSVHTIKKYEARIRKRLGAVHMIHAIHLAYAAGVFNRPQPEVHLFSCNRPQALAIWNLSFRLPVEEQIEIFDTDNYGALMVRSNGKRWKLPQAGGVVPLADEVEARADD
jgi:DNA-binding CsgD family transcriptional regulator/virulence-associated protein VagC